jgi:hypothetical protein
MWNSAPEMVRRVAWIVFGGVAVAAASCDAVLGIQEYPEVVTQSVRWRVRPGVA